MARPLIGAVLTVVLAGMAKTASAQYFSDALAGPSSPNLSIDFSKYGYTAGGLLRTHSLSGTFYNTSNCTNDDRPEVKTISGGYLSGDFIAEITLQTAAGTQDIAYFGLGQGFPNTGYCSEPTDAFLMRIHDISGYNGAQFAVAQNSSGTPLPYDVSPAGSHYDPSGTTFRITRIGDNVTLSIPSQPGASTTVSQSAWAAALGLNASNTYVFFGNSAEGTTFSNLSIKPIAPAVTYSWSAGGFGACQFTNNLCGAGTQTQTVTCKGSDGSTDPTGTKCSGTPPASSQSCNVACTPAQLIQLACPPNGAWKNHGAYVSCVAKEADKLLSQGLITGAQKDAFVSAAAQSSIGK